MKNLYLIRHAEAESPVTVNDIERQLTDNGKKAIVSTVNQLKDKYNKPDLILVSPAKRTQETAERVKETWECDTQSFKTEKFLYDSEDQAVFHYLQNLDNQYETVAVIGHNPTLSMLVNFLTNENIHLAPANICVIEFDVDTWDALSEHAGIFKGMY